MFHIILECKLTCLIMKKLFIIYSLIVVSFLSCKKDDSSTTITPDNGNGGNTSTVPTTFSQKVLLEEFTGASQAQCPDGFVKMDNILAANPNTSIPVEIHYSDAMELNQYTTLYTTFNNGNGAMFPSALINRIASLSTVILNRTQWQSNYDVAKTKSAGAGLSIKSSVSGTTATVEVHCGFNQILAGNYSLTVYLCENNVVGSGSLYDQRNSYNTSTGHPYFGAGDPIVNFNHNYVLRNVISAPLGDAIPTAKLVKGGEYIKTYTINIASYKLINLNIVAFISKTGIGAIDQPIVNVQKAKLGTTKNWD